LFQVTVADAAESKIHAPRPNLLENLEPKIFVAFFVISVIWSCFRFISFDKVHIILRESQCQVCEQLA
jgi:hypothetical protein